MMMDLATTICIMFACVSANHMGLIGKIEEIIHHPIPVLNCPMCATFWGTLIYMVVSTRDIIGSVAISFFFAYLALWLELVMCLVDYYYKKIYEKIVSDSASDETTEGTGNNHSVRTVSDMRK